MDRAALTAYLATEYDVLLGEADIATTDTPDGLAPVLDNVAAIVDGRPDLPVLWHQLVASYVALDRVVKRFAANMDVSISGDSYRTRQQFENAKALRDELYLKVAWLVDPEHPDAGSSGPGTVTTIEMPFLTGGDAW